MMRIILYNILQNRGVNGFNVVYQRCYLYPTCNSGYKCCCIGRISRYQTTEVPCRRL